MACLGKVSVFLAFLLVAASLKAQQISAYSDVVYVDQASCIPHSTPLAQPNLLGNPLPPGQHYCLPGQTPTYTPLVESYSDTEEDYTASLYYDVTSTTGFYYGPQTLVQTASAQGNPSAGGSLSVPISTYGDGIYAEDTFHILDFYYTTSAGSYYDPYGFYGSTATNGEDGAYSSNFWLEVYAYGRYIAEASVILGETSDIFNQNTNTGGPRKFSVAFQAFIPPDWIPGPPNSTCLGSVYLGDNRGLNPSIGSYRALQQIVVGVGGLTPTLPGFQDTGWTYRFAPNAIVNGVIPPSSFDETLGDCSLLDAQGHASTATMQAPSVSYSGGATNVTMNGTTTNPVPLWAWSIKWMTSLSLTETSPTTLNVTGAEQSTCYPAMELSVGQNDVYSYVPPSNISFGSIAACLGGFFYNNSPINKTIILAPAF